MSIPQTHQTAWKNRIYREDVVPMIFSGATGFILITSLTIGALTNTLPFRLAIILGVSGGLLIFAPLANMWFILKSPNTGPIGTLLILPLLAWFLIYECIIGSWRSDNRKIRLRAIRRLKNQEILFHCASDAMADDIERLEAIANLSDRSLIMLLVRRHGTNDWNDAVCMAAVQRLDDNSDLMDIIVDTAYSPHARYAAARVLAERIEAGRGTMDKQMAANIVRGNYDRDLVILAMEKLNNPVECLHLFLQSPRFSQGAELLAKQIAGKSDSLGRNIVDALNEMDRDAVISVFEPLLEDVSRYIRVLAAWALQAIRWEPPASSVKEMYYIVNTGQSVKPLIHDAGDLGPIAREIRDEATPLPVKAELMCALAETCDTSALHLLAFVAADNSSVHVRSLAADILAKTGKAALDEFVRMACTLSAHSSWKLPPQVKNYLVSSGRVAAESLIRKTGDDLVNDYTFNVLKTIGQPAVTYVADAMGDRSKQLAVRERWRLLLSEIGYVPEDPRLAVVYYTMRLVQQEWDECVKLGHAAVTPLLEVLEDRGTGSIADTYRSKVCDALGRIGAPSTLDALVRVMKNDRHERVRMAAASALAHLGYEPDKDETRAEYFFLQEQYSRCASVGVAGLKLLLAGKELGRLDESAFAAVPKTPDVDQWISEKLRDCNDRQMVYALIRLAGEIRTPDLIHTLVCLLARMPSCVNDYSERDGMFSQSRHGHVVPPSDLVSVLEKVLESDALASIGEEDLHILAKAGPFEYSYEFIDYGDKIESPTHRDHSHKTIACEELRALATQELLRR